MTKLTCVIIDDEEHAIAVLKQYILAHPDLSLLFTETSPVRSIKKLNECSAPDIIFCDIDMPELSGLDLPVAFSKASQLVYTTAFEEYATVGYEKDAVDYMVKPITQERFNQCIVRCRNRKDLKVVYNVIPLEENGYFFISATGMRGNRVRVTKKEIVFVESIGNYLRFHLHKREYAETYMTFSKLTTLLDPEQFIRVHRSFLVNIEHIVSFQGGQITFDGIDRPVPISGFYKDNFINALDHKTLGR